MPHRLWRRPLIPGKEGKGDRRLFWQLPWAATSPQGGFQAPCGRGHCLPVCRAEGLLPIHTGAQGGEFMINERLINPVGPVGREIDGSGVAQMRESQARPGPVHRVLD